MTRRLGTLLTEGDVRTEVERRLKRRVAQPVWDHLVKWQRVMYVLEEAGQGDDRNTDKAIRELIQEAKELEDLRRSGTRSGQPDEDQQKQEFSTPRRGKALSLLMAHEAAQDKGVQEFWGKVGAPIGNIKDWIIEHQGPRKRGRGKGETLEIPDDYGVPDYLTYIARRGILFELKQLASGLCEGYGWQESQSVFFLLTKKPPPRVYAGRAEYREHAVFPCLDRIIMELDATLSAPQVLDFYRIVWSHRREQARAAKSRRQAGVPGSRRQRSWRPRKLGDKAYQLIEFVCDKGKTQTWRERHLQWNTGEDTASLPFASPEQMKTRFHEVAETLGAKRRTHREERLG